MAHVIYRALTTNDYECWSEFCANKDPDTSYFAEQKEWFEQCVANNSIYGCILNDQIIGHVIVRHDPREKLRHKCRLVDLYVLEGHRNRNYGFDLTSYVLNEIRKTFEIVQICTETTNEYAIQLFTKSGFQEYGLEPKAMKEGDRYVDLVEMYREL